MLVYGIDFTSSPASIHSQAKQAKWLPVACGVLMANRLNIESLELLNGETSADFSNLTKLLTRPGPWIMGIDAPLGMPQSCVAHFRWLDSTDSTPAGSVSRTTKPKEPNNRQGHVLPWERLVRSIQNYDDRREYRKAIEGWREKGIDGHLRQVRLLRVIDQKMGGASPMNCVRPAVGLMFFEVCRILKASPVSIWPVRLVPGERREVLEVYPRLVATSVIGSIKYKDGPNTSAVRAAILVEICQSKASSTIRKRYGMSVKLSPSIYHACVSDPSGDKLDAVLCAIQAAYAFQQPNRTAAIPCEADLKSILEIEGWVCDPSIV